MKKLVLSVICSTALAGAVMAQGNVSWGSISFTAMTAVTNTSISPLFGGSGVGGASGATVGSASAGTGFYYQLLYMPTTTSFGTAVTSTSLFDGTWQNTGLSASNSLTAGRLTVMNGNNGAQVPWSPGTTDNIVLVGWSANLGSSWLTVSNELATGSYINILGSENGFFGVSTVGYITTLSTSTSPGAAVFGTGPTAQGTPIYSLNTALYALPVPEPTTIALAGLGGLAMLAFRRRKA